MARPGSIQVIVAMMLAGIVALNLRILSHTTHIQSADAPDEVEAMVRDSGADAAALVVDCDKPVVINIQGGHNVSSFEVGNLWQKWEEQPDLRAKVLAHHRNTTGYLTIGIPSIQRVNGMFYLMQTLSSLIQTTTTREKTQLVVVVFLADFDQDYNNDVMRSISESYMDYINIGFIHVIQAYEDMYPNFTALKRNFNDKEERVKWRSKQVIDFAFMFSYSMNISKYYIQIEDDVQCANKFVPAIKHFIMNLDRTAQHWALLEFSELGFIGKLVRSSDLKKFSDYLLLFFEEQPVDWLLTSFRLSMAQRTSILRKPTLFQHQGLISSFDTSKNNKLKDRFFAEGEGMLLSDDPPGYVVSNMESFQKHSADLAYAAGNDFFWAKDPKQGDFVMVVFDEPQPVDKVLVNTGDTAHPRDKLKEGAIEASHKLLNHNKNTGTVTCANFRSLGKFVNGELEVENVKQKLGNKTVQCLRVVVQQTQTDWIIFRQIAVFLETFHSEHGE